MKDGDEEEEEEDESACFFTLKGGGGRGEEEGHICSLLMLSQVSKSDFIFQLKVGTTVQLGDEDEEKKKKEEQKKAKKNKEEEKNENEEEKKEKKEKVRYFLDMGSSSSLYLIYFSLYTYIYFSQQPPSFTFQVEADPSNLQHAPTSANSENNISRIINSLAVSKRVNIGISFKNIQYYSNFKIGFTFKFQFKTEIGFSVNSLEKMKAAI